MHRLSSRFTTGLTALVAAAAVAVAGTAVAQDKAPDKPQAKTLKVGDKAPAIKVGSWIKGKPVKNFKEGNVYVMEFWATWCGPCIRGIPKLTALQKEYKDKGVTVVGTAIWQRPETQSARTAQVTEFVEKQGDKMDYTIAIDDDRTMSNSWMRPAGRNGIPSAFIVGKTGKIEWIGHPGQINQPLKQILAGTFDVASFAATEANARAWATESRAAERALATAIRDRNGTEAMQIVNDLAEKYPDNSDAQKWKYRTMLQFARTRGSVLSYGARIAKMHWDDSGFLNAISWWTVDDADVKFSSIDQATEWAQRADELTKHKDAMIIDTLARCLWEQGKQDEAIALQQKAVRLANPTMKDGIKETLKGYLAEVSQG